MGAVKRPWISRSSAVQAGGLAGVIENGSMATCSGCGIPFTPRRLDQLYHSRKCADSVRWKRKYGPEVPGLPPKDCDLFTKTLLSANKPANAFGYRLRCEELGLWFPAFGSRRWDDRRPRTDYYTLEPLELPRVPLRTLYEVGWTVPGGILIPSGMQIFISFARKSRSIEVAARIRRVAHEQDISDRLPDAVVRHEVRVVDRPGGAEEAPIRTRRAS